MKFIWKILVHWPNHNNLELEDFPVNPAGGLLTDEQVFTRTINLVFEHVKFQTAVWHPCGNGNLEPPIMTRFYFQLWLQQQVDEGRKQDAARPHQPWNQQITRPSTDSCVSTPTPQPTAADGFNLSLCQKNQLLRKTWVFLFPSETSFHFESKLRERG